MLSNNDIVADLAGQLLSLGQPRFVLGHPPAPKVAQTQDLEAGRQQRSLTRRLVGNSEGAAWSLLSAPSQLNIYTYASRSSLLAVGSVRNFTCNAMERDYNPGMLPPVRDITTI